MWGRFYFRYNVKSNEITDLLIAPRGADNFSKGLLVFGKAERIKKFQQPKIPFMKMVFGGSPIEILLLFIAFITSIVVLKNALVKKRIYLASILSQFQVILACIGAYGITGTISFFGSIGVNNNARSAPLYFDSLVDLMSKLFFAAFILFALLIIKLPPDKRVKFWMYSNLIVIPAASLAFLILLKLSMFG